MASARPCENSNRFKIIIIGAGIAGLSAASHLVKNGILDFKILEARNRIGGRIISVQTENHKVELGANWIHGVLGNPMYELAMANGLIDIVQVPKPHRVVAANENGKQIPFDILQEICEAYVCFLRRCEEYFLCHYLPPEGVHSVGEHIRLEISLYLDQFENEEDRKVRELLFDCLLKRESCITGCDSMDEIDLLELGSYTELQGGNIVLPSGYSSILGAVAQNIPPENILKKHPVSKIRWRYVEEIAGSITSPGCDSGIGLVNGDVDDDDSDDSDKTVTGDPLRNSDPCGSRECSCEPDTSKSSECSNSKEQGSYEGKSEEEEIKQPCSSRKLCTSNSIGPPPNAEIVCEDGSRYYADHVICTVPLGVLKERASSMFSPPLPKYKLDSIKRLLFETVDKIILEYDRPFLNPNISEVMFLWDDDKEEDKGDISKTWFHKIYSFSKITETLLLGWVSGKAAEYMETLHHEQVSDICTNILRTFLNDPFVPKPKCCICTSWHSQVFVRGSYTAMAVGASQIDIENLSIPLYAHSNHKKPSLLFAGEHTHSSFYSTVHGAYLTGRSAAQILVMEDSPDEVIMECEGTSDLSSWIQGISLD